MGFWIFMLIIILLIPAVMIVFGRLFINRAPEKINAVYGYRAARSMKNRGTWKFAYRYCGKIWHFCGPA